MKVRDQHFFGGLCAALQIVANADSAVLWKEIVLAAGAKEVEEYVTKIEPDEREFIKWNKYKGELEDA